MAAQATSRLAGRTAHGLGRLNDINGLHVRPEHAVGALEAARSGPVDEGAVGGGTGMNCLLSGLRDFSSDITAVVIRALAPSEKPRISHERRTEQMHTILRESARLGNKHVLIIEEAHDLATPTLKAMKRFYEDRKSVV